MHAAARLSKSAQRLTPGAAACPASCKVQLDSAARTLPLASCAWSEAGGAWQTFMHPHTLSHQTNMYSSTVTHLHTQWHVNRHSQHTHEITPNSETVKLKFSCMMESDSLFCRHSTAEGLKNHAWCPCTHTNPLIQSLGRKDAMHVSLTIHILVPSYEDNLKQEISV